MPTTSPHKHYSKHPRRSSGGSGGSSRLPTEISQIEAANRRYEQQIKNNGGANGADENAPVVELTALRALKPDDLAQQAEQAQIENAARMRKHELLFALSKARARDGSVIKCDGTLEILTEGYGFLRDASQSYVAGIGDIYVNSQQIRRHNLRTGDTITGRVRMPLDNERYFALVQLETINGKATGETPQRRAFFDNLTPLFPDEQLRLERDLRAEENITARVIDLISPIGKGQRGLLVASPKSGKTVILQQIAHAIEENYPDVTLMVLLIDERPEEVTEMKRSVRGEVVSSTFDETADKHVQVAEMVMEKAKRLVEQKQDVVILLDSITRLARAYNTLQPTSGRVLSGGVDAGALQRPKRFFGAARKVEEGGSLTIIATALIETGSKMDEVIYEEFKGTGNMELHLDRRIAERRTYPAILIGRSSTRREELLLDENVLRNVWVLRKALSAMDEDKAIDFFLERMRQTKSNEEFFNVMKKGG